MQPITLNIYGEFWDSQIYQGRLYLFCYDGSIKTLNWDALISSIKIRPTLKLAVECAFKRSDYLYGGHWDLFFSDPDIKNVILRKFQRLANAPIDVEPKRQTKFQLGEQDNPFPFPHADSTIYKFRMYVAGRSGVWGSNCNKRNKYPVSTRPEKKWDCPSISVAASYNTLALSAGKEGLWQVNLDPLEFFLEEPEKETNQVSARSCDNCEWMFHSIYGSSYDKGGFLAEFNKEVGETDERDFKRQFSKIVSDKAIFKDKGYSWGTKDKMYLAHDQTIKIARYNPYDKNENFIELLDTISIAAWKGDFVSGGVSTFGAILEYDNAVVVIPSDGPPITLPGEPINWRVFPNSRYYQNHLHITYDDKLVIHSFNHDYFVKQSDKLFGTKPELERSFFGSQRSRPVVQI